jgi:hypothetical protein
VRSTLQEWYLPKYLHYMVINYENDETLLSSKQMLMLSGSNLNLGGLCWVRFKCVRFEVFMAATMKNTIFWILCHIVWIEVYWHFRVTCCFHIQGQRGSPGSKQERSKQSYSAACLFLGLITQFWNGSNIFLWNTDKLVPDYMVSHPSCLWGFVFFSLSYQLLRQYFF